MARVAVAVALALALALAAAALAAAAVPPVPAIAMTPRASSSSIPTIPSSMVYSRLGAALGDAALDLDMVRSRMIPCTQ